MNEKGNSVCDIANILYQSSGAYAPIMGVSITSLFENNTHIHEINVYITDGGIGEEDKKKISELCEKYHRNVFYISGDKIDKLLADRGVAKWRDSYAMYYKLYALDLIEEPVDRLLAIDADTIINRKIDPLYCAELDDKTLGMVQDFMPYSYMKQIGMGERDIYYNSGVVLFDAERWRRRDCLGRIEAFLKMNLDRILYADQDAISIVLQSEIKKLPIIFNLFTVFPSLYECLSFDLKTVYKIYDLDELYQYYKEYELLSAEKEAVVYHYVGGTVVGRPWEKGEWYSIFNIWEKYKAISPWRYMEKREPHTAKYHAIEKKLHRILPHMLFAMIYKIAYDSYWRRILRIRPNN